MKDYQKRMKNYCFYQLFLKLKFIKIMIMSIFIKIKSLDTE